MAKPTFMDHINDIVKDEFDGILREAKSRYGDEAYAPLPPKTRNERIREYAQLLLISKMVEKKGAWLTVMEMQYTMDLFHERIRKSLRQRTAPEEGRHGHGLLSEARAILASQQKQQEAH